MFPRGQPRGPIEAFLLIGCRVRLAEFPRGQPRGPIEAFQSLMMERGQTMFPRGQPRGPIEATRPRCWVRTGNTHTDFQELAQEGTLKGTHDSGKGFEVCEVLAAWPDLPEALRAAVLAIIRTHRRDLSTNRGSGTQRSEVERSEGCGSGSQQASHAGAKPEQPVCGQVGHSKEGTPKKNRKRNAGGKSASGNP